MFLFIASFHARAVVQTVEPPAPVPLDKGNGGSGNEIAHVMA